jgi:6-phosphogluconolactonase
MSSTDLDASLPRFSRIDWNASTDEAAWIDAAATAITTALRAALDGGGEVHLLLSGGTTPAPVYQRLAAGELDWSRVVVGLVDDRDVEPDAQGSNARLIRETLLQNAAAAARFELLRGPRQSIEDAVRAANTRWRARESLFVENASREDTQKQRRRLIVVLGMGDDGHTASLFPGALNLAAAFASTEPYAAIDASGCKVAGAYPHRISLTPHGLAQSTQRLLLIRGAGKRAVFEHALQAGDAREMPIRAAIDLPGAALLVHWCP